MQLNLVPPASMPPKSSETMETLEVKEAVTLIPPYGGQLVNLIRVGGAGHTPVLDSAFATRAMRPGATGDRRVLAAGLLHGARRLPARDGTLFPICPVAAA